MIPGSKISPHDKILDEHFLLTCKEDTKRDSGKELGEVRLRIVYTVSIFCQFL